MGNGHDLVAVRAPNGGVVRLAQPRRALADGVEHGLNVGRRVCDNPEDFAGRCLLLKCFSKALLRLSEFAGPLLELLLEVDR